jgi:hypothetical protein
MCNKEKTIKEEVVEEEYICPHKAAFFIMLRSILYAVMFSGLFWIFNRNIEDTKKIFGMVGLTGLPLALAYFLLIIRRNKILELSEPENK